MSNQHKDKISSNFSKKRVANFKKFLYMGSSMHPTLKPTDILDVISCHQKKFQVGDVIVFSLPEKSGKIVHRIISVDPNGVRTRGDNNKKADSWIVKPGDIQGYVIHFQRRNKQRRILGSMVGPLMAKAVRTTKLIYCFISVLLKPIYHRLALKGINSEWLNTFLKIRVISFCRPAGKESHLLIGRRVIGRRPPGKIQWQIKFPFRLFIGEKFLVGFKNDPTHDNI